MRSLAGSGGVGVPRTAVWASVDPTASEAPDAPGARALVGGAGEAVDAEIVRMVEDMVPRPR